MIAKGNECWSCAWGREDIGEHGGAPAMYDSDVSHFGILALGHEVPSEGNVLGTFPEACLFGKSDCGFTVFVQYGG